MPDEPHASQGGSAARAPGAGPPAAADPGTYEVIEPAPAPAMVAPKTPAPLLAGFDDDADFERDPEVEAAARGGKKAAPRRGKTDTGSHDPHAFVKPGLGDERVWVIAGVVLMIAAVIAVLVNAPANSAWRALLVAAQCLVHAATGVAAIGATASIVQAPLGKVDLAAARMFAIVGLFQLVFNLNLHLMGSKLDEIVVAASAYVLALWLLFRRPVDQTMVIAGFHFLGWLAVFVIGQLYAMAAQPAVQSAAQSTGP